MWSFWRGEGTDCWSYRRSIRHPGMVSQAISRSGVKHWRKISLNPNLSLYHWMARSIFPTEAAAWCAFKSSESEADCAPSCAAAQASRMQRVDDARIHGSIHRKIEKVDRWSEESETRFVFGTSAIVGETLGGIARKVTVHGSPNAPRIGVSQFWRQSVLREILETDWPHETGDRQGTNGGGAAVRCRGPRSPVHHGV